MKQIKQNKKITLSKDNNTRMNIILVFMITSFIIILGRILYLNVFMGDYYNMLLNKDTEKYIYGESAPRGRILDRNGKVLVDNKAVRTIYYKKPRNITTREEIDMAYRIITVLKLDYGNILDRNLREFYILIHKDETDKLITNEEYKKLNNRKLTENEIYELKIKRIKKDSIKKMQKEDKMAAYVYYLMNKGYSYQDKIIKDEEVSNKEYIFFSEENTDLKGFSTKLEWERVYPYKDTLGVILGSVSTSKNGIPKEEAKKYLEKGYNLNDRVGISGLEKYYEEILRGEKARYKLKDNKYVLESEGKKGTDIMLSIDIDLQIKIDEMLEEELIKAKSEANTQYFNKSYVVIQNPTTGEILSMSGKKLVLKNGSYKAYDNSEGAFLSTITPGSVVKGASIMVGYNTGKLHIGDYKQDSCIYLYNLPEKCSWRTLGYINDIDALAFSSNVYQYKIAMSVGGFDYYPGKKLKIDEKAFDTYRNMFYRFGLGVKTGIDYPKEEDGYKGETRAGDLLINYAIGQYDTYTTLQLSQYVSTIANGGTRYKTRFLKAVLDDNEKVLYEIKPTALNTLEVKKKYIDRVRLGFRNVITRGTGYGYMNSAPDPSGKTGTSESMIDLNDDGVVDAESISNNFVGYAPSNKPTMSIAAAFPDIQNPNTGKYKSYANQQIVSKATTIYFNMYDKNGKKKGKN